MRNLTDEQIQTIFKDLLGYFMAPTMDDKRFARAIEAAVTEPLLQRIAELEKALKLVRQHHATAWNRGHIAGMAANRMVAQDALNAVKKDAWNNTQLTEALMTAEARCEELERQLEEARKQMDAQKDEWLSWETKRKKLEKDADRWLWWRKRWSAMCTESCARRAGIDLSNVYVQSPEQMDFVTDAAMQKGQS